MTVMSFSASEKLFLTAAIKEKNYVLRYVPTKLRFLTRECSELFSKSVRMNPFVSHSTLHRYRHGLWTPGEEIAFSARPKTKSQSQIFRYGRSIFCLPHRPRISDFFDLYLHSVSVVRGYRTFIANHLLD